MEKGFVSAHKKKIGAQSIPSNPRKSGWEEVRGAKSRADRDQCDSSQSPASDKTGMPFLLSSQHSTF